VRRKQIAIGNYNSHPPYGEPRRRQWELVVKSGAWRCSGARQDSIFMQEAPLAQICRSVFAPQTRSFSPCLKPQHHRCARNRESMGGETTQRLRSDVAGPRNLLAKRKPRLRRMFWAVATFLVVAFFLGVAFASRYPGFTLGSYRQIRFATMHENRNLWFCVSYWLHF